MPEWVRAGGFAITHVGADDKVDMSYSDLAAYVEGRIREALAETSLGDPSLENAAMAAARWATSGVTGSALQRWVSVLARR